MEQDPIFLLILMQLNQFSCRNIDICILVLRNDDRSTNLFIDGLYQINVKILIYKPADKIRIYWRQFSLMDDGNAFKKLFEGDCILLPYYM